jgi:Txe/YoeB family toxin of Txe-Axe toxin-antitoxin module
MIPDVLFTNTFEKLCGKKRKNCDQYIVDKLEEAVMEIISSNNPEHLGIKKQGNLKDYYSYVLTREHRILYTVEREGNSVTVIFKRVCDHKNVYGKD